MESSFLYGVNKMKSKKEEAIDRVMQREGTYRCPICHEKLQLSATSLRCENNHSFDLAKQGYVHFAGETKETMYDAILFEARQNVLQKTMLYDRVQVIIDQWLEQFESKSILDVGCGEGTHTARCIKEGRFIAGVDLAKDGIQLAAKTYRKVEWFVADLANLPYENESFDTILNILSPANEREFRRILKEEHLIIKVVPNAYYLTEIRQAFTNEAIYDAKETHEHIKEKYDVLDAEVVNEKVPFTQDDWANLVQMTPLSWHADAMTVMEFLESAPATVTIDVTVYALRVKRFANEEVV